MLCVFAIQVGYPTLSKLYLHRPPWTTFSL